MLIELFMCLSSFSSVENNTKIYFPPASFIIQYLSHTLINLKKCNIELLDSKFINQVKYPQNIIAV